MHIRPFGDADTFSAFANLVNKLKSEIQALEDDYVLKASQVELETYFVDKVTIQPLVLHPDQYYIDSQSATQIDVSHDPSRIVFPGEQAMVRGTRLDIAIPFDGDPRLWRIRPSTYTLSGYPMIEVRDSEILLTITFPDDAANTQRLKGEIDNKVRSLQGAIDYQKSDVDGHNKTASQTIRAALASRISSAKGISGAVAGLGIPIKKRDEPLTYTVPTTRRRSPVRPKVSTEQYKREPVLSSEDYEHILSVTRSMSVVMERSPDAFATLDEEAIRTHFLIQLNGHYEGGATGETFNASGKTDILIRVEDRNIFIAECKFWRGPKYFEDAVDQLLSYLSWRDTKSALLVFNRSKDTTAVKEKMHEIMKSRPECKKILFHHLEGDSRYIFVKESDPGREITITTQLYDMPSDRK